jgi:hypothetical protein
MPMSKAQAPLSVGGLFVEALARRDFAAMADCLDADVRFRALVPPGPFEIIGRDQTMERFGRWFGGPDELELLDTTIWRSRSQVVRAVARPLETTRATLPAGRAARVCHCR